MVAFQEGGWPVWAVLACALFTHPLAIGAVITAFASHRKGMVLGLGAAALLFSLSTACTGVAGYLLGMRAVEQALAGSSEWGLDASGTAQLRAQGQSEASWNLICGALGAALPLLLSLVALARGATMGNGDVRR